MMTDDEMYQSLLLRFRSEQARRKKRLRTLLCAVPVPVCVCLAAGAAVRYLQTGAPLPAYTDPAELPVTEITAPAVTAAQTAAVQISVTAPVSSAVTVRDPETARTDAEETQTAAADTAVKEPAPADAAQTEPSAAKPVQTVQTSYTEPSAKITETSLHPQTVPPQTEPPAVQTAAPPDSPGSPGAVFTSRTVSFAEAQALFGHPIVPCGRDGFQRYQAGIVSRNGNVQDSGAYCLSVTYVFADGAVTLTDWDRMNGSDGSPDAEQISYCGRTFYIERPAASGDSLQIAYYAAGFDPFALSGLEYRAVFGTDADIDGIMDLMISLII